MRGGREFAEGEGLDAGLAVVEVEGVEGGSRVLGYGGADAGDDGGVGGEGGVEGREAQHAEGGGGVEGAVDVVVLVGVGGAVEVGGEAAVEDGLGCVEVRVWGVLVGVLRRKGRGRF